MYISGLRIQDRLDGTFNLRPWRERMYLLLVMNDLCEFSNTIIQPPTNATNMTNHRKNVVKSRLLILDVVRDHIIPHISGKKISREMWDA